MKTIIEHAVAQARDLGHNYVGTEHLFLALVHPAAPPTIPNLVFQQLGVTHDAAREAVISLIGAGIHSTLPKAPPPPPISQYQSLVYTGAVTLLSRRYISPLQPEQIAECVRDAQAILNHVTANVRRT